jgi:hypothetical protein
MMNYWTEDCRRSYTATLWKGKNVGTPESHAIKDGNTYIA